MYKKGLLLSVLCVNGSLHTMNLPMRISKEDAAKHQIEKFESHRKYVLAGALCSMLAAGASGMACAFPCVERDGLNSCGQAGDNIFYRHSGQIFFASLAGTYHYVSKIFFIDKMVKELKKQI